MLDTARQYETPEGIDLEMRIAGPVVRACAWAIDLVIRFGLYGVISILFAFFGGIGVAFYPHRDLSRRVVLPGDL